jgi:hypothetical protein
LDSVMAKGIVGEAGEKEINNRLYWKLKYILIKKIFSN